ncbi:MAG: type IX secretion system protein PorQ [Bacteroidia bacterium]
MTKRIVIFILFLTHFQHLFSQTGGNNTYEFLNLSSSARLGALGGTQLSVQDNDLNLAFSNPALLNPAMSKAITFSYVPYFADIKYGYAGYAQEIKNLKGTFSAGIHFVNYGEFIRADVTGEQQGTFNAAEYSFNLSYSRLLHERVTGGFTLKTIYSSLEDFSSTGMAVDLGIFYHNEKNNFGLAGVIKNIGMQLSTYTQGDREPLPFEVQLGISYRLPKAPLRLSLTATHLEKPNLTYTNPALVNETDPITGEPIENKISLFEKIACHAIIGGEILITQNFHLRLGYNYMRRQDLGLSSRMSISGFSGGFGFRISKFHFSYGRAAYHVAGASNHFSITTNISEFSKKKKEKEIYDLNLEK